MLANLSRTRALSLPISALMCLASALADLEKCKKKREKNTLVNGGEKEIKWKEKGQRSDAHSVVTCCYCSDSCCDQ